MNARFSSFESRRWLLACVIAAVLVGAQVVHAARVTGSEMAPTTAVATTAGVTPAALVEVAGSVVAVADDHLVLRETGGSAPVAFPTGTGTVLVRDGTTVGLSSLRSDDAIRMTVDAATGRVLHLTAVPGPEGPLERLAVLGPAAALGLVVAAVVLVARLRGVTRAFRSPVMAGRRLFSATQPLAPLAPVSGPNRPCGA